MATGPIALTRNAWVDLGSTPCRVFVLDPIDAAVLVISDTTPSMGALGFVVSSTYWQGFVVNGKGAHVWGRALRSSVSVSLITAGGGGSGIAAPGLSADKTTATSTGAKPNSTVVVYKNGAQAGTAVADATGAWSFTFSAALQAGDIVTYDAVLTSPGYTVPSGGGSGLVTARKGRLAAAVAA